jgi:hypothetical protein
MPAIAGSTEANAITTGTLCLKLFRGMPLPADAAYAPLLGQRVGKVRGIVAAIKRLGIGHDDFEATAVVQHYSPELDTSTWLLDVTSSPWVALFFASDRGDDGDIGTLEYIELAEWQSFSNRGASAMGRIRVTSADLVPRIANQQAFFIQAPHPKLFEQLHNRMLYFRQQRGVTFESEALDPPVSRSRIYPATDLTIERLQTLAPLPDAPALDWEPTADSICAPDWMMFRPIARSVLELEWERRPESRGAPGAAIDWDEVVDEVCRLHAAMYAHRTQLPWYICSLHHLRRAIAFACMVAAEGMDIELFLDITYFQHCRNDVTTCEVLRGCLRDASPFWREVLAAHSPH